MVTDLPIPESTGSSSSSIEFSSLLQLRWGAIICQVLLIVLIALSIKTKIPYLIVSTIIIFETASNLFFHYRKGKNYILPAWLFGGIMFVDVVLLTVLLFQTGGVMNPFSFLYLLHIVIGAILMPAYWVWGLTIFTNLCYLSLYFPFFNSLGSNQLDQSRLKTICIDVAKTISAEQTEMDLHLKGMLVAFALTSLFIVYFIGKIRNALALHNVTLLQLKEERSRSEQLASLATLAAGTAHELSTPLSTIKLVTGEMLQTVGDLNQHDEIKEDLDLVRSQIEKCEDVLYQMSEGSGEHRGEQFQLFSTSLLIDEAIALLPDFRDRIAVTAPIEDFRIYGPKQTFKRTLKSLLKNAIDADTHPQSPIELLCSHDSDSLLFTVKDNGPGMDHDTLVKATEPFYTTKSPGAGMGLGLFLAKSVAERFGGSLSINSAPGKGTAVTIIFSKKLIHGVEHG